MGQALRQDRVELARDVARQAIAHLDRRGKISISACEHRGKILPGMTHAGEEQRDLMSGVSCDDAGGEDAGALAVRSIGERRGTLLAG